MESELSPDNQKNLPPVPIRTYQWEDLRKAREAGGYPWTHLLKAPLEGEVTAEDIIRATTPRRSMSREVSKSRTHSPIDKDVQKILNLDSSPGSSRKHSEEGKDEGVHIPNFSKEISLDSEDDIVNKVCDKNQKKKPDNQTDTHTHLMTPVEKPLSVSPKSILKRRIPEQQYIGITETREKTKCCHPLVNKIKHLADKTLHKLDKNENEKSPGTKRKKNEESQEIRQLKNSPGAVRRQKFSAIKLGDSDEMSKTMCIDTPPPRKKKEHIYEDIEESREANTEKSLQLSLEATTTKITQEERKISDVNENDSITEKKSNTSQDPSLIAEDNASLKADDLIMEKLHKIDDKNKEAILLDEEMDSEEPNVEEVYQNQKDDTRKNNDSPNITITEILEDDNTIEQSTTIPIESSPSPSPRDINCRKDGESIDNDWSRTNSDHDYEIIDKPPPNIIYTAPSVDEKPIMVKTDDELSSTTSLERKYLQHTSDEDEQIDDKDNINSEKTEELIDAETLQKDIEERFFVNTPSTVSRTECEVSTSQVDSSALENLPLKRSSRNKNADSGEHKIQQRIKEGTGKIKTQAGKLKTKLHNLRNKQFSLPERPKFKMPDRPKISFPDRPKLTLPDKRKFSLPERPKFKKINISEKLSFGDRKKFSFPERPKFSVPDMPKFKMPDRPKINFPSLGRKKEYKVDNMTESTSDLQNVASVDFEAKTYPRLFNRKKKSEMQKTSSSPTLNREDTPPPTFTFTRVKKLNQDESCSYIPDSPEEPREYGTVDSETNYDNEVEGRKQFSTTYDFDKLDQVYIDEEENQQHMNENRNANSISDISPSKQEYTHINELNNDEFFVRPRGISRENIQVREYLSDEIRQAFNIPKNVLAVMGSNTGMNDDNIYANEPDEDPELMNDSKEPMSFSTEDINDRDDGYYTFPPVRPSRAKRKKRENESIKFIDDSVNASMQFSEVDLGISEDQLNEKPINGIIDRSNSDLNKSNNDLEIRPPTDLRSIHEYANDDVIEYPEGIPIQSQTLPMPPKRKRKFVKKDIKHSSLNDFNPPEMWQIPKEQAEDIIVYRTEHEYIVPQAEMKVTEHSPLPPRRTRSRSSRATSLCDDDRTSHGAESLILDTHVPPTDDVEIQNGLCRESPGYATVDKGNVPTKTARRSKSKTPPTRQRKSHSAERKYYTVHGKKSEMPSRPPRKKSSTSLMTLNSYTKDSINGDLTQYDEIDEPRFEEVHKDLQSGEVVSKMKDRPLPPPPRPPRGPKRKKTSDDIEEQMHTERHLVSSPESLHEQLENRDVIEIEVSTQTDPLPDDIDFELGLDENLDISMSSSLKDIIDEESILGKAQEKVSDPHRASRPVSRSEKSLKLSDPKISDFPKINLERTSPTVILVEKRVSSPTRINEREEILTEASLTVQPIDIEESLIPDVPPLPKVRSSQKEIVKNDPVPESTHAIEKVSDACRDVQLDNLVTQRLQVSDLDVGRLNVSELQATKILVSDIEGMTLNVNEMDSKSGHISVSGIEFSQSVIDEIVKKFAEISTTITPSVTSQTQLTPAATDTIRPVSREEETQTDNTPLEKTVEAAATTEEQLSPLPSLPHHPSTETIEEISIPPQRPPPPDLTPLLYSYLQDLATPMSSSLHPRAQSHRERHLGEFHDTQHQTPPPPARRSKRKPAILHSESSSDEDKPRPSPRRIPPPVRIHEPTITEAGAQFFRVCQTSISRTFRNIFNIFMTYINRTEDKRDVQMAMVIFLVLIAGLIMFGLSDSRTIHHHHWEFFNPPDGKQ